MREIGDIFFHRSWTLPRELNIDETKAVYKNGVLTVTVPKSKAGRTKSRKINIENSRIKG